MALLFEGPGALAVDSVSVFPSENVAKGAGMMNPWPFRADLLGALKALQPAWVGLLCPAVYCCVLLWYCSTQLRAAGRGGGLPAVGSGQVACVQWGPLGMRVAATVHGKPSTRAAQPGSWLVPRRTLPRQPGRRPLPHSFLRFPGGCYIEGDWMRNAYRWKDSLGRNEERSGHMNGEGGTRGARQRHGSPAHPPTHPPRSSPLCRRLGLLVHGWPGPV